MNLIFMQAAASLLAIVVVLIPLFIYHRFNGKDLSRYSIRNSFLQEEKKEKGEEKKDEV